MPNTGKPSLGCHLCRARRVKCDLTQPSCLRCAKLGRTCHGYRRASDLVFRNQNTSSYAAIVSSGRRKKQGDSKLPIQVSGANIPIVRISPQIQDHWSTHSVPLVLNQLSAPNGGGRFFGYMDFLPDLYRETSEKSCLTLTTNAVARVYISNTHATSDTKELARMYATALRSTQEALQDSSQGVQDATIMSVWLLGIYEILVGAPGVEPLAGPRAWHIHSQGLATLLRLRGPCQFSTRAGRNIFWVVYHIIQIQCILAKTDCPEESLGWFEILQADLTDYDRPCFDISYYTYSISSLRQKIHRLIDHGTTEDESPLFPKLLAEADAIENQVLTWTHSHPSALGPHPADLPRLFIWNMYRGVRSKLHDSLIQLFNHVEKLIVPPCDPSSLQHRRQTSICTIRSMAQEIVDSIPYGLEDPLPGAGDNVLCTKRRLSWSGALRLLWSLKIVSWSPLVLPHQRAMAQAGLKRIGWAMGIRQALTPPY